MHSNPKAIFRIIINKRIYCLITLQFACKTEMADEWCNTTQKPYVCHRSRVRYQFDYDGCFGKILNCILLIPTTHITISVAEYVLKNYSRRPEEQLWSSGCQPRGSTLRFVFCSRLNFLITAHLFNNKHDRYNRYN